MIFEDIANVMNARPVKEIMRKTGLTKNRVYSLRMGCTFHMDYELLFALQYGLLGAATGMAMNLLGCVRNVIFVRLVAREKRTTAARIVFSGLFLLFTALTWAGPKSILSGVAKVLSTVAYGSANLRLLRGLILVTSSSWFVYNALVGSWAGCVCEALTIGSILVAFFRDFLQNKQHCNEEAHS